MRDIRRPHSARRRREKGFPDEQLTRCQQAATCIGVHPICELEYAKLCSAAYRGRRVKDFQDQGKVPALTLHRGLQADRDLS